MVTCPTPAMPCAAPRDRVGVPKTVIEIVAELPEASVTVTGSEPGAVPAGIIKALVDSVVAMLPFASDVMNVVFAVVTVLYQVVAVPPMDIVNAEVAANPAPLIGTTNGALIAVYT